MGIQLQPQLGLLQKPEWWHSFSSSICQSLPIVHDGSGSASRTKSNEGNCRSRNAARWSRTSRCAFEPIAEALQTRCCVVIAPVSFGGLGET